MDRIYISGKITGTTTYLEKFTLVEKLLTCSGFDYVINPAKINANLPKIATYKDYMDISMSLLSLCESILMLPDWGDSNGARAEWRYANEHNYNIYYLNRSFECEDLGIRLFKE